MDSCSCFAVDAVGDPLLVNSIEPEFCIKLSIQTHNRRTNAATAALVFCMTLPIVAEGPKVSKLVVASNPADKDERTLQARAHEIIEHYCISCHGPEKQKGKVRFDAMETIDAVDLQDLFLNAQDALHFEEMPPEDEKRQPTDAEREVLLAWLKEQLTGEAAGKLAEKMRRPEAGNYVNHEELFSGKHANLPAYTEDRRWMISEHIFENQMSRILGQHANKREIDGKRVLVDGSRSRQFLSPAVNLGNPFLLPNHAGVRYYANSTLDGGHLQTMLANVKEVSANLAVKARKDKTFLPAIKEIMEFEDRQQQILAGRRDMLKTHVERLLIDAFGDRHQAMLPEFVRVEVPEAFVKGGKIKKAPYHAAAPVKEEAFLIFLSMQRHQKPGMDDAQLIEAMEREWFYHGHNKKVIKERVTFLINYMSEFRDIIEKHNYARSKKQPVYKPLVDDEMQVIGSALRKHRKAGDTFQAVIDKCLEEWERKFERQRVAQEVPAAELLDDLVAQTFELVMERSPTKNEVQMFGSLCQKYFESLSRIDAIEKTIQTVMLNTDFVYRSEFGKGEADEHGRRLMSPHDASYALAYALTDASPDAELAKAAAEGRLNSREDYEREVRRMLARRDRYSIIDARIDHKSSPNFTNMPVRELRFFREFFGYDKLLGIFKDNKRYGANYDASKKRIVAEADKLVEYILESDQDVFKKLLTTDEYYVYHSGDNEQMKADSERIRKIYDYFKDKGWRDFTMEDLRKHKDFIAETKMRGIDAKRLDGDQNGYRYNPLKQFTKQMESFELRLGNGQKAAAPYPSFPAHGPSNGQTRYGGALTPVDMVKAYNIDLKNWDYPTTQPSKLPNRKGILTHPAWLISFSGNTQTDPIHKGIWIRKKLLADTIPDVPITVDAVIPENPHKTLRQRLDEKTNNNYCMRCHEKINPLGLPFEMYDDFGRYRTEEFLEHPDNLIKQGPEKAAVEGDLRNIYKSLPIDPSGYLDGTRDSKLDGEVRDALDLIDRLAKSDRVRQSIIRHAFRYFMGRNETLNDSKTLMDADQAYLKSGGSFDELIVSLLTSDSFIYRKAPASKD